MSYDRFYIYLEELSGSYSKLAELLGEKIEAVNVFDPNRLDEIMKEEQAYVMMAKSFSKNIQSHRDKLSLKGETLSEIVAELPPEQLPRFQNVSTRLRDALDESRTLNEKCQSLIEARLHVLDKSIKGQGAPYDKPNKETGETQPHLLNQSI